MKYSYNIASIYNKAPDLLFDKIAEVNGVLAKVPKNSDSFKFWKSVHDTMKFAWGYMNDFIWIIKENENLKAENEFLRSWTRELSERLSVYESIKAEKIAGTFDETVNKVDNYLNGNQ